MSAADRFASAPARRLALDLGLGDVAIVGTGREGRVTISDVRLAAQPAAVDDAAEGLGDAGRGLWDAVRAEWELRPDEETLLLAACRTLTVPGSRGQLRPHPLLSTTREHRRLLRELLGSLGLAEADAEAGEGRPSLERSHAGRRLARQRWSPRSPSRG